MQKNTMIKRLKVLAPIVFCCASLCSCGKKQQDIAILYTNDVHCQTDFKEGSAIGYEGVAGIKAAFAQDYDTVLVDCGDAIQGGSVGAYTKGEAIVKLMNQVEYDYGTFGNHEFDYGVDRLLDLVEMSNMNYVSSTFTDLKTNKPVVDPYKIHEFGGVKVAFLGISTPESLWKSTPTYFQDANRNYIYSFLQDDEKTGKDFYEGVTKYAKQARKEGADYVIALAHLGLDDESGNYTSEKVIANTSGIDVVLDGHSHSKVAASYVANKEGKNVLLSQTETKLSNVGLLTISTNGTKKVKDDMILTQLISTADYANGATKYQNASYNKVKTFNTDVIKKELDAVLNAVVAHSEIDIYWAKEFVRAQESVIGDLCADAYRNVLDTDIAFVNGGGIRAGIKKGDITKNDVITIHPYGNAGCVVEATGQEIIDALEMGAKATTSDLTGASGGFLQVSGLKYTIDATFKSNVVTAADGKFLKVDGDRRVKDVFVGSEGNWTPIDLTKTYTLASHNYMLKSGGDGISMFMDNKLLKDEVKLDNEILVDYINNFLGGSITEAQYGKVAGRITIL